MKYLSKFETRADYIAAKAIEGFRPSTSLVDGQAKYDPALFSFNPKYLYSDLSTGTSASAPSGESVIGVEVIPASHTPNRKARYVSLKNMSRGTKDGEETVETGSVQTGNSDSNLAAMIPWGVSNEDVECLTAFENHPKPLKNDGTHPLNEIDWNSENDGYYAPADTDDLYGGGEPKAPITYPFDWTGIYWTSDEGLNPLLPYPFLPGGERNPMFGQPGTALADMNGFSNTQKLVARVDQSIDITKNDLDCTVGSWGDAGVVRNYPAAVACYRYNAGDFAGRWYLPALGELAYLWANIAKINAKLAAVAALDSTAAVCIGMGDPSKSTYSVDTLGHWLWSSSQQGQGNAWSLDSYYGYLDNNSKFSAGDDCRVRAFFQL